MPIGSEVFGVPIGYSLQLGFQGRRNRSRHVGGMVTGEVFLFATSCGQLIERPPSVAQDPFLRGSPFFSHRWQKDTPGYSWFSFQNNQHKRSRRSTLLFITHVLTTMFCVWPMGARRFFRLRSFFVVLGVGTAGEVESLTWPWVITHASILGRMNTYVPPILMFTRITGY